MSLLFTLTFGVLFSLSALGDSLDISYNAPSQEKKNYCNSLVRNHGYLSFVLNELYQSKGVLEPSSNRWKFVISSKPCFFQMIYHTFLSKLLKIVLLTRHGVSGTKMVTYFFIFIKNQMLKPLIVALQINHLVEIKLEESK